MKYYQITYEKLNNVFWSDEIASLLLIYHKTTPSRHLVVLVFGVHFEIEESHVAVSAFQMQLHHW